MIEELRGRIHRGELGPGDRLPAERELASRMHVSRDRVREALLGARDRGLPRVSKRGATGGRFVTELATPFAAWAVRTEDDLDDIVDFRLAVECEACRFAATTPDAQRSARDAPGRRAARRRHDPARLPARRRRVPRCDRDRVAERSPRRRGGASARGELFEPADELWKDGRIESLADHRHILDAIQRQGAPRRRPRAMAEHIERTRLEVRELVRRGRPRPEPQVPANYWSRFRPMAGSTRAMAMLRRTGRFTLPRLRPVPWSRSTKTFVARPATRRGARAAGAGAGPHARGDFAADPGPDGALAAARPAGRLGARPRRSDPGAATGEGPRRAS